jgi:ribosome-associated toxin RatA of RatAB toxin-antitoxin module
MPITHDAGMRLGIVPAAGFLIGCMLLSFQPAFAQNPAPETNFSALREGESIVVSASVDLPVAAAQAWSVLADYERYPQFITGMRESRIIARGPSGLVVEQKGEFGILFFSQEVETRMLVVETPPHSIVSRSIGGSFREMEGRYELQPLPQGVRLIYSGRLVPEFGLPPLIGMPAVRYVLRRNFSEMVDEIMRGAAPAMNAP